MPTQTEYKQWLNLIDEISLAVSVDEANPLHLLRVGILRARMNDSTAELAKVPLTHPELLPPIQRQPGKRVRSRDVPCPTCGAKAGNGCFRMSSRGRNGTPTDTMLVDAKSGFAQFHLTRTALAKQAKDAKASTRAALTYRTDS